MCVFGKSIPRASIEKTLYSATAFLVVFNLLTVPFALPKLGKFLGAPFLPSSRSAFRSVFDHMPELKGKRMIDVGSGDGRLLATGRSMGMTVMGIEMNPWLVLWSKWRLRNEPVSHVKWANAWKSTNCAADFKPDLITFYGRPGQGILTKFGTWAESVGDIAGKTIIVASNKFPIPGWQLRQIAVINEFYIYKLHSNTEPHAHTNTHLENRQ